MGILFGHPAGSPFSHNAALAHFEAGRLDAFCVPWIPSELTLRALGCVDPLQPMARRLARRRFAPLERARTVQGRVAELGRLAIRALGLGNERLSYAANDWLMRTMQRECRRQSVSAVHAYEDCSLWQFEAAARLGKACLYDMPIGYYPAWEELQADLVRRYPDWLPAGGLPSSRYVRPDQKRREMELADLVLVPGSFVEKTILAFHPGKRLARAVYGVDLEFWRPAQSKREARPLRFIYAGQLSIRKGIPMLLEAWAAAGLRDAELQLVGLWQLSDARRAALPVGVSWSPPCSSEELRERYRGADAFVFPSFFEGFGLVLLEAMACGLPAIATDATAGPDILTPDSGEVVPSGNLEALVESLRRFERVRESLPEMGLAARRQAELCTWDEYRRCVTESVAPFV